MGIRIDEGGVMLRRESKLNYTGDAGEGIHASACCASGDVPRIGTHSGHGIVEDTDLGWLMVLHVRGFSLGSAATIQDYQYWDSDPFEERALLSWGRGSIEGHPVP